MTSSYHTVFFGTPEFAVTILEKLIASPFAPSVVITAPEKPVGRKQKLTPSPVKILAEKYNISVLSPQTLDEEFVDKLKTKTYELFIVAAYGKIISKSILDIPKHGNINVHPSLLPKLRGASPIQNAILEGLDETGVTIMLMDEKMDHGPIITNTRYKIQDTKITAENLSQELASMGANLLIETLPRYLAGDITPKEQNHKEATYTKLIKKDDGHINWEEGALQIERLIRAYTPWPGAYAYWNDKQIKFLEAETIQGETDIKPGEIYKLGNMFAISTAEGALVPTIIQLEGKSPVDNRTFLQGYPEILGIILA